VPDFHETAHYHYAKIGGDRFAIVPIAVIVVPLAMSLKATAVPASEPLKKMIREGLRQSPATEMAILNHDFFRAVGALIDDHRLVEP
jgi:hypothetical protein